MKFPFPAEMQSALTEPAQRLARFAALVNAAKALGDKDLTQEDCEQIFPLYEPATKEVDLVVRGTRNARHPIPTEKAREFLASVFLYLIDPLTKMKRYVFMPFDQGDQELESWGKAWAGISNEKKGFEYHQFSPYKKPFANAPLLSQIYIIAHGSAGSKTVATSGGLQLGFDTLAYRMKQSGLVPQFWGKIKVYACSAGKEGPGNAKAFTELFATCMRSNYQFKHCQYFGYQTNLRTPLTFATAGKYTHTTEVADKARVLLLQKLTQKYGATLAGFHSLPPAEQVAEWGRALAQCQRECIQANEQKPSAVRKQF